MPPPIGHSPQRCYTGLMASFLVAAFDRLRILLKTSLESLINAFLEESLTGVEKVVLKFVACRAKYRSLNPYRQRSTAAEVEEGVLAVLTFVNSSGRPHKPIIIPGV